jgi:hypothetical protein
MADSVQLTDLDVIARYSIAVRTASADRDELIETLRADLEWLERNHRPTRPAPVADAGVGEEFEPDPTPAAEPGAATTASRSGAAQNARPAPKRAAKKAAAKKPAVKKTGAARKAPASRRSRST